MIKQRIQKPTISMSFNSLDLSAALLRAISDPAHLKPTPVQRQAHPVALEGKHIPAGVKERAIGSVCGKRH
jgi:superfamily II DNA/RNA helicase